MDKKEILNNLFRITSAISMVGWLMLFFIPDWVVENPMKMAYVVIPVSLLYAYLIIFGNSLELGEPPKGNFFTLSGVVSMFSSTRVVLAGWVHYLAFDLIVGIVILNDSVQRGITHWYVLPCLFATLMFGPIGVLLYFALIMFVS